MADSLKGWRRGFADDENQSIGSQFDNSRQQTCGISGMILKAGQDDRPHNLGLTEISNETLENYLLD